MNTTYAKLQLLVAKADRRYIQLACFAFMLAGFFIIQSPSDGGSGSI